MSAAKTAGGALGAAGVGTGITVVGWPAIAAVVVAVLAGIATACWIVDSPARTVHLTWIISAFRSTRD